MKQTAILAIIVLMLVIALGIAFYPSKDGYDGKTITEREIPPESNIEKVVIDSCEYITWGHGLAHKGNCRFCAERQRNEINDLIKQFNK